MSQAEGPRARAARWMMTGLLAMAPVASGAALTTTPAAPTVNGVLWCCVNPYRVKPGPKLPGVPAGKMVAIATSRLRRGRLRGQVADMGLVRRHLRRRKRRALEALIGPARFVRLRDDAHQELPLLVSELRTGEDLARLERALAAVPGVAWARGSLAGGFARVGWPADVDVDPRDVVAAATAAGFPVRGYDPGASEEPLAARRRDWLSRLAIATFGAVATMFLAEPLYWGLLAPSASDLALAQLLRYLGMVVGTATAGWAAWPFLAAAVGGLSVRWVGMDALAAVAVGATWLASVIGFVQHGPVYFDSLTMFVALLVGSRLLDGILRERIMRAVEHHVGESPEVARLVRGGVVTEVPVGWLVPGNVVDLRAGDRVPADGVITRGRTGVDEALLTGESLPVVRGVGDALPGGAIVVEGLVRLRVTRVGDDATQGRLARLAAEADRPSGRAQQLADRVGHWGTLALLLVAGLTGLGWWLVDPARAMPAAIAVLVITCPCALGLAIPAANAGALASALRRGLLVKRAEALEALAAVRHVVFDKTGTLTLGEPVVVAEAGDPARLWRVASALEAGSTHPLARAVISAAGARGVRTLPPPEDLLTVPGSGLAGTVEGRPARIGTAAWLEAAGMRLPADLRAAASCWMAQGRTVLWVGHGGQAVGLLAAEDSVRPEAPEVLARLASLGLTVSILTGDHADAAARVADRLGVTEVAAGQGPEEKRAAVAAARRRHGVVAVVGDGLNDAPALAAADVGLAIARGADLAAATADVVLVGGRLTALTELVALARRTRAIVRENLTLAMAYNAAAIPLAIAGHVSPLVAAVLMPASSLVVLLNTVRRRS
ncbi:MAG: cation-translocating P-type ATPase [Candidatus Sericytochromatia bacterium]|nr:cation-translocating P-type ATPase [Candidatus Sericytochromatia bacterium]